MDQLHIYLNKIHHLCLVNETLVLIMSFSVFDLYKIGIGPSSSHTVGPIYACKKFLNLIKHDKNVHRVKVQLFGALSATGNGHATHRACVMGLLDADPITLDPKSINLQVDSCIKNKRLKLASGNLLNFDFKRDIIFETTFLPFHPNGLKLTAYDNDNLIIKQKTYYSVGGGFVVNEEEAKNNKLPDHSQNLPYPFTSSAELLDLCQVHQLSISDLIRKNECVFSNPNEISHKLQTIWSAMYSSIQQGISTEGTLPGGLLVKRRAPLLYQQLQKSEEKNLITSSLGAMDWVNLYALAVNEENAAGGKIVTAPTNGAAGIIPSVLNYYLNFGDKKDPKDIERFLLCAAAIGILCKLNASISGAEVGCQGEVGSACAMAAAGLTEVLGGTPEQVENAAEIGLEHNLGLTCDPVKGLVQIPCIERNAMASVKAINAAQMALRGNGSHYISLDQVIQTMRQTGLDMQSKYKETSKGGLAVNWVDC